MTIDVLITDIATINVDTEEELEKARAELETTQKAVNA